MTREDVLREYNAAVDEGCEWISCQVVKGMADRIVALEAALAAAPKVTVTDRWACVSNDGSVRYKLTDNEQHALDRCRDYDGLFLHFAPHTVRRVALLDDPTTRGEG